MSGQKQLVFLFVFATVLSSCGVKALPLPPESATPPKQSQENTWGPKSAPSPTATPASGV